MSRQGRSRSVTPASSAKAWGKRRRYSPYRGSIPPAIRSMGYWGTAGAGKPEMKFLDTAISQACDTTGAVTPLNLVAQGDDFNQRDGRTITIKKIMIRGIMNPQDSIVANTLCRVMVFNDMQANGTTPAITDVLTAASSNTFQNLNNRYRFKILKDDQFVMAGTDQSTATLTFASSPQVRNVKIMILCNIRTCFSATTGVIGSVVTGVIQLLTVGNQAAGAGYSITGTARIRFIDG